MPKGTENFIFSQMLPHNAIDSIANSAQGPAGKAAAECARNMRMCEGAGYPLVRVIFSAMGQPSLTHANGEHETIYSDLSNAPLRIAATGAVAPMPSRKRLDGTIGLRGRITSVAECFMAESGALLRFAGAEHATAAPVWHEHCATRNLTLSLQAHR